MYKQLPKTCPLMKYLPVDMMDKGIYPPFKWVWNVIWKVDPRFAEYWLVTYSEWPYEEPMGFVIPAQTYY